MNNLPNWARSSASADPQQISLSIESFGKSLIGLVSLVAIYKGLDQQTAVSNFQAIIDQAATGVAAVFTAYHTIVMIFGLARKAFYRLVGKPTPVPVTPTV